jgi:hypothetical protein
MRLLALGVRVGSDARGDWAAMLEVARRRRLRMRWGIGRLCHRRNGLPPKRLSWIMAHPEVIAV